MQKKALIIFACTWLIAFSSSCTKTPRSEQILDSADFSFVRSVPLSYATQFTADEYELRPHSADSGAKQTVTLLTIATGEHFLLASADTPLPEQIPESVTVLRTPVTNIYLAASSAMSLFSALDSLDHIRFSALKASDWYIPAAKEALENGSIVYAGKYSAPDFELLVKSGCPLAIESMMITHTPHIKEKLEALGIPVFIDRASYEAEPLGRLEWILCYALLLGKSREAEAFFHAQCEKVRAVQDSVAHLNAQNKKRVAFFYVTANGMIVVRGAHDYIVRMIEQAGGEYAFSENLSVKQESPSVTISMEQFYALASDADCLIYNSSIDSTVHSIDDLCAKNALFAEFSAVKHRCVWRTTQSVYQASDRIGDLILDIHRIITDSDEAVQFLEHVQ